MKKLKIILVSIESVQVFYIFKKNEPNLQLLRSADILLDKFLLCIASTNIHLDTDGL